MMQICEILMVPDENSDSTTSGGGDATENDVSFEVGYLNIGIPLYRRLLYRGIPS